MKPRYPHLEISLSDLKLSSGATNRNYNVILNGVKNLNETLILPRKDFVTGSSE